MTPSDNQRLTHLQAHLKPNQALLLTDASDIHYFSQFSFLVPEEREGFLFLTPSAVYLLHASFSPVPDNDQLTFLSGINPGQLQTHLQQLIADTQIAELLVDKTKLFAHEYDVLLKIDGLTLKHVDRNLIWNIRMVKDDREIEAIRQAGKIADQALAKLRPQIKAGMTEKQIGLQLELEMMALGSERPAFPTIVAFNDHAALPHHQPTPTPLEPESGILIDFGATYHGYRSDMTRSFWFGSRPDPLFSQLQTITHQAYDAAIKALESPRTAPSQPLTAALIDTTARSLITQAGFGDQFIHTTGHGVGLDIHEQPSLNWSNDLDIKPGMVITIEPGIYIADQFGYRHENTVAITDSGYENLTEWQTDANH